MEVTRPSLCPTISSVTVEFVVDHAVMHLEPQPNKTRQDCRRPRLRPYWPAESAPAF